MIYKIGEVIEKMLDLFEQFIYTFTPIMFVVVVVFNILREVFGW